MSVLLAVWLLVIGYGLVYVGYKNLGGSKVSFQDAFFPAGLFAASSKGQAPGGTSPTGSTFPLNGRSGGNVGLA